MTHKDGIQKATLDRRKTEKEGERSFLYVVLQQRACVQDRERERERERVGGWRHRQSHLLRLPARLATCPIDQATSPQLHEQQVHAPVHSKGGKTWGVGADKAATLTVRFIDRKHKGGKRERERGRKKG